jgi:hypothetical protein
MAFRGAASASSTSTTQTVNVNSIGIQLNDIVLLALANFIGNTPSFPVGFTQVTGTSPGVNDGNTVVLVYSKIATGAEPTSYSITGVSFGGSIACRVYSGRNTSSPFTATQQSSVGAAAFPITFSMTGVTAASNDDVVAFAADQISAATTTATLSFATGSGFGNGSLGNDTVDVAAFWIISEDAVNVAAGATGTIGGVLSVTAGAGPGQTGVLAQVISLAAGVVTPPVPSRGPMPKQIYILP